MRQSHHSLLLMQPRSKYCKVSENLRFQFNINQCAVSGKSTFKWRRQAFLPSTSTKSWVGKQLNVVIRDDTWEGLRAARSAPGSLHKTGEAVAHTQIHCRHHLSSY